MAIIRTGTLGGEQKVDNDGNANVSIYDGTNQIGSKNTDVTDTDRGILVRNITGNSEQLAGGYGRNSFSPFPDYAVNVTTLGSKSAIGLDSDGNLITRGQILTDEGNWRDDFSGGVIKSNLTGTLTFTNGSDIVTGIGTSFTTEITRDSYIKHSTHNNSIFAKVLNIISDTELLLDGNYTGATISTGISEISRWNYSDSLTPSVTSSLITLASGTTAGITYFKKLCDTSPINALFYGNISQRIANQIIEIGFFDDITNPTQKAVFSFSGTSNTVVDTTTSIEGTTTESKTSLSISKVGFTSANNNMYQIDFGSDKVSFFINDELKSTHNLHIPDPYQTLEFGVRIINSATVTNTNVILDMVTCSNQNRIEINNKNQNEPLGIRFVDKIITLSNTRTINTTTADQQIINYTVPTGYNLYLKGFNISNSVIGGVVKITRNGSLVEPAVAIPFTASEDNSLFDSFIISNVSTSRIEYHQPKYIAKAGDTIGVYITQTSATNTVWRVYLDVVLR